MPNDGTNSVAVAERSPPPPPRRGGGGAAARDTTGAAGGPPPLGCGEPGGVITVKTRLTQPESSSASCNTRGADGGSDTPAAGLPAGGAVASQPVARNVSTTCGHDVESARGPRA